MNLYVWAIALIIALGGGYAWYSTSHSADMMQDSYGTTTSQGDAMMHDDMATSGDEMMGTSSNSMMHEGSSSEEMMMDASTSMQGDMMH